MKKMKNSINNNKQYNYLSRILVNRKHNYELLSVRELSDQEILGKVYLEIGINKNGKGKKISIDILSKNEAVKIERTPNANNE